MSEPYLPVPPPENIRSEDQVALGSDCGMILQNLRPHGQSAWEGWCQDHGRVTAIFRHVTPYEGGDE